LTQLNPDEEHFMGYNNLPLALHPSAQTLEPSPKTHCSKKTTKCFSWPHCFGLFPFYCPLWGRNRDGQRLRFSFPSRGQQFKSVDSTSRRTSLTPLWRKLLLHS